RTICDAFDQAWAFWQGLGSDLTEPSKSLATQTILAKRIIEMADHGLRDIPALRDDALAFLQHGLPSDSRNGLGEAIGAQAAPLTGRWPQFANGVGVAATSIGHRFLPKSWSPYSRM